MYRNHIYYPMDETTGEIIPDRIPSMFLSLYDKIYLPKTIFYDLDSNIIDHKMLCNKPFTFIPLLHLKKIHCNHRSHASLKIYIKEAIVTSFL